MAIRLLFSRSTEKSRISVLIAWLAACVLSSAAAGQPSSPPQTSEEVQRLTSECDSGKYASCHVLAGMYALGRGVAKDEARAAALSLKACDGGVAVDCANLAGMYALGRGVAKDEARAAALFQRACDWGEAAACAYLADMYWHGRDVGKDEAHAAALF